MQGLPADSRVAVAMSELNGLRQQMVELEGAMVIALSSESVFGMSGPLPEGSMDRGYFDFDDSDSLYGGRLMVERLAAIYLLSTDGRNFETHQVAFFDDDGRRVYSVYVPRDDAGALKIQPQNRFLCMKQDYDARIPGMPHENGPSCATSRSRNLTMLMSSCMSHRLAHATGRGSATCVAMD